MSRVSQVLCASVLAVADARSRGRAPPYARTVAGAADTSAAEVRGSVRGLGRLFARALATHRDEWVEIATAAAISLIPAAALQGILRSAAESLGDERVVAQVALTVAWVGAGAVGYFFLSGVIAQIVVERRGGAVHPRLADIARSLPYGQLLLADLVISAGTAAGLELLIVPGIVFAALFALAPVLIETRHLRAAAAMRRSRELVRGAFWETLVLLVAAFGLVALLALPLDALIAEVLSGPAELEHGIAALLAGIAIKPFAAIALVELAIELDESR